MAKRKSLMGSALAAVGVAAMIATAAPASADTGRQAEAAQTLSAARSTQISVINWTGCELRLQQAWLDHGIWSDGLAPVGVMSDGASGRWQSESNGFLTGTEGHVIYDAENCKSAAYNGKRVQLHWNNPYGGSNSYDSAGSDPLFRFASSGGSGNNAALYWQIMSS
ncbi:aegerolysin family protein [Kitasatospora sp. NPDC086801]|uniref:aegerolysin family protein n=1 Tax=Kitasatospora sp. NPDC086801 TaxID=3364066 RepID=UPI00382C3C5B